MPQAVLLIEVVKNALRERGLTYARVAEGLGLSESSVKRVFSQENLSLDRLEQICALMDLEITDLFDMTRSAEKRITELTEEQEQVLVSDPKVLLIAILAINHWTAAVMLEKYRFSESELVALLVRLDRLGIIDLLPGNRIKVRLAHNFSWRKGGPIQRFFEERVQEQFFKSSFLGRGELRITLQGSLSAKSNELLQQRMRKVAEEFDSLVGADRSLDHSMRDGMTMVMAIRPWELALFTELRRVPAHPGPGSRVQEK
jgi:transcriptional regulator with XRE-family HTH domain